MPTRLGWTALAGGVVLLVAGYGFGFVQLVVVGLGAVLAVGLATASVGVAREFVVDSSSPASAWW